MIPVTRYLFLAAFESENPKISHGTMISEVLTPGSLRLYLFFFCVSAAGTVSQKPFYGHYSARPAQMICHNLKDRRKSLNFPATGTYDLNSSCSASYWNRLRTISKLQFAFCSYIREILEVLAAQLPFLVGSYVLRCIHTETGLFRP